MDGAHHGRSAYDRAQAAASVQLAQPLKLDFDSWLVLTTEPT